jgi:hypothetical protein
LQILKEAFALGRVFGNFYLFLNSDLAKPGPFISSLIVSKSNAASQMIVAD